MAEYNYEPFLFGYTSKDLWDPIHIIVITGWILLIIAPRWKYTSSLTLIPPFIQALIYVWAFIHVGLISESMNEPTNSSMKPFGLEHIYTLFSYHPDFVFVGWVHYLCFDLLVGRGITLDIIQRNKSSTITLYVILLPCLFLTFVAGPIGFLLYMIIQLFLPYLSSTSSSNTKSKHK